MKKRFTLGFLTFLLFAGLTSSGQSMLGFDSTFVINFPDTVVQNDTAGFAIRLKNYGPVQVDTVRIFSGYKNNQGFISGIAQEAFYPNGSVISIPANATIGGRAVVFYTPNRFPLGIDVVVIWPKAFNAQTVDTLEFSTLVINTLSAENMLHKLGFTVYPNPFKDIVHLSTTTEARSLKIFDLKGHMVYRRNVDETVDLSQLPEATYVFEIEFKNGTRRLIKVIKSISEK